MRGQHWGGREGRARAMAAAACGAWAAPHTRLHARPCPCMHAHVHAAPPLPPQVGADLCMGSLIKNGGGTIVSGGGYVAGRADLVERAVARLTAPGIGIDAGCVPGETLRLMFQGAVAERPPAPWLRRLAAALPPRSAAQPPTLPPARPLPLLARRPLAGSPDGGGGYQGRAAGGAGAGPGRVQRHSGARPLQPLVVHHRYASPGVWVHACVRGGGMVDVCMRACVVVVGRVHGWAGWVVASKVAAQACCRWQHAAWGWGTAAGRSCSPALLIYPAPRRPACALPLLLCPPRPVPPPPGPQPWSWAARSEWLRSAARCSSAAP